MAATEGAGSLRALLNWWGALVGLLLILTGGLLQPAVPWWDAQRGLDFKELPITSRAGKLAKTPTVIFQSKPQGSKTG